MSQLFNKTSHFQVGGAHITHAPFNTIGKNIQKKKYTNSKMGKHYDINRQRIFERCEEEKEERERYKKIIYKYIAQKNITNDISLKFSQASAVGAAFHNS